MKKLFDRMVKIAIAMTEKRHEDEFSLDWDIQFLISLANYVSTHDYDGTYYLAADEVAQHVKDEVKPPFNMRTESLGRKLDKWSLIKRGWIYVRDKDGKPAHKRAWLIDVKRLNRLVAPYQRFLPTREELEKQEQERLIRDLEGNQGVDLSEREKPHGWDEIGKPSDWED
jgi:hypothetical protein